MNDLIKGKVIKGVGGLFTVYTDSGTLECKIRKKTRFEGYEVLVGDDAFVANENGFFVIERVCERRNALKRPRVANVDKAFIVIAPKPAPDLMLVDKIIINCIREKILPYIVVNKSDIAEEGFLKAITEDYEGVAEGIFTVSAALNQGIDDLKNQICGSSCCFVGQSAVGKTSIMNAITGFSLEIGGLSKIQRGMHTTRHNEFFVVNGGFLADTAGFSLLDEIDIESAELCLYYGDFSEYASECRFNMCTHTSEPDCAVKEAVELNKISERRYSRYLDLYKEIKDNERRKY